jgi:REP element-mobilizing transposase RayT
MARRGRIIIPGCAHFVVHHSRAGVPLFRDENDRALYRDLLSEKAPLHAVAIGVALLEPDRVELLLTPATSDGLARAIGATHRLYARHRDLGEGALWAGRFQSCPLAPALACGIEGIRPMLRAAASRGRPVGDPEFIAIVESQTGRDFTPRRRGRKPKR